MVVAIILIAIAFVLMRTTRSRLRPLPDESRDRYARTWQSIEARFIDDPAAAVQEADKTAVMILSERGANLTDHNRMPDDLRKARAASSGEQGRRDTEAMRASMVHYKAIVDDAVGADRMKRQRDESYRREMAS